MKTLFSSIINIDYTDQGLNCGGLSYQVSQGMGNHQVWTTRWRYRAGWESLFKVESVVFAVMLMEMLNQDSTKMEENMEKESLLHNISQGRTFLDTQIFVKSNWIFDPEKARSSDSNFNSNHSSSQGFCWI